jgi:hypothetical protein
MSKKSAHLLNKQLLNAPRTAIPSLPFSTSLPCNVKDIQTFILRKPKFMRRVEQFNGDETLPSHLIFQFFKKLMDSKCIQAFDLKWNYSPGQHTKPEIIKAIFKRHCQSMRKYAIKVVNSNLPYHYNNLWMPLKNVLTLSIDNNKDIRKLLVLRTAENVSIHLRIGVVNYRTLYNVLYRLPNLKNLQIICLPEALNDVLLIIDELTVMKKKSIKFEIIAEGQEHHTDIPKLQTRINERIGQMSFQHISPETLLDNLFINKSLFFSHLKILKMEFNNIDEQPITYFRYLREVTGLEKLTLIISECQDKAVAGCVIKDLKLPLSLQTLELNIPLHLSSLLKHTKHLIRKSHNFQKELLWRNRNIFEEEPSFVSLFETFEEAKKMKRIVFDFHLLEDFNPHYTNFIVSILSRLRNISALEIQVRSNVEGETKNQDQGCFDLLPFFKVCSMMPYVEQIDILMPNLLFTGAEFNPITTCLKSFTIGVDEKDEEKPIKFENISKPVEKLLKTLTKYSPDLENLNLDYGEVLTQETLAKRFWIIQKFQKLEALGGRFFIHKCNKNTVRNIGTVLRSLKRLNIVLLKFLETGKTIYNIENYIKYHKSIKNMLIQFNDSAWMDNDCLVDPLRCDIKEMKQFIAGDIE